MTWSQRYIKQIHHFLVFIPKFGTEVLASRAWNELNHALFQVDGSVETFHMLLGPSDFLLRRSSASSTGCRSRIHGVVQYPPRWHHAPKMRPEGRTLQKLTCFRMRLFQLFLHFNLPPHRNPIQSFHFIVPPPHFPSNLHQFSGLERDSALPPCPLIASMPHAPSQTPIEECCLAVALSSIHPRLRLSPDSFSRGLNSYLPTQTLHTIFCSVNP